MSASLKESQNKCHLLVFIARKLAETLLCMFYYFSWVRFFKLTRRMSSKTISYNFHPTVLYDHDTSHKRDYSMNQFYCSNIYSAISTICAYYMSQMSIQDLICLPELSTHTCFHLTCIGLLCGLTCFLGFNFYPFFRPKHAANKWTSVDASI